MDAFWTAAAQNLANLIIKTGWEMIGRDIGKPIKQQIFKASRRYIQNYRTRHGQLKVLGMGKPASLESIYTDVQILNSEEIQRLETIADLEKLYRQRDERSLDTTLQNRKSGIEVANTERYLTVLGGPGMGKSTFLRKIGLETLKGRKGEINYKCIPVFLELKRLDAERIDIESLVINELSICGYPEPEFITRNALRQGYLLVLLDGLDEVPAENLTKAIWEIHDFIDKYSRNRFIASCRTAAYHGYFKRCTDVVIAAFGDDQIKKFIANWFQDERDKEADTPERCWELLTRPANAAAFELAHTPLLLTFLCLVYGRSQNLPDSRSTLYHKALDILLEEWAAEKRIQRSQIYQGLHTDLEKALLSEMAFKTFSEDKLFFSKRAIINHITKFLTSTLKAPEHLNGEAILHAMEVQQGILVERAENVYSFSHVTIQEFLTARYIAYSHQRLKVLVAMHLTDDRWHEVFLLIAGLCDSADDLLLLMEKQASKYISGGNLKDLFSVLGRLSAGIQLNFSPLANRILTTGSILKGVNFTTGKYYLASKRIIELAEIFNSDIKKLINDYEKDVVLNQLFNLNRTTELTAIRRDIKKLTQKEVSDFCHYLTAISIILKCKQASVSVSKRVWNDIEMRMLAEQVY
ncbi:MAG: NACHT domain-containing protein [Cyanobacteria bacterium P01_H01_bin.21]